MSSVSAAGQRSVPGPAVREAAVSSWLAASALLSALWAAGYSPNGDDDDLLKAVEVRHVLETGQLFDRTLPGISQPEPYLSHWPWITDAPYAAVALLLRSLVGTDAALHAAFFIVPLLLLVPVLWCLHAIVRRLGFVHPEQVFVASAIVAAGSLVEFEPGRIDYHNMQIALLLTSILLLITHGRRAALANGVVTALAIASGLELCLFFATIIAIHACDYVFGDDPGGARLRPFGIGLALAAAVLFAALVAPADYAAAFSDRYCLPHALALVAAGLTFAASPLLLGRPTPGVKACAMGAVGLLSGAAIAGAFPEVLHSPYAHLTHYLRTEVLGGILQERSILERPDFLFSPNLIYLALLVTGACGSVAAALATRGRDRAWLVLAIFACLALAHGIMLFRYLRFAPMLVGPGLAVALAPLLPKANALRFANHAGLPAGWSGALPLVCGAAVVATLLALCSREPGPPAEPAADLAGSCETGSLAGYAWPAGSRLLAPPRIGIRVLGQPGVDVVGISYHRSGPGLERIYRFLDPRTADPRAYFDAARATLAAVCAWHGEPLSDLRREMPLAAGLIEGNPPSWLLECPAPAQAPLRLYRRAERPQSDCPVAAIGDRP